MAGDLYPEEEEIILTKVKSKNWDRTHKYGIEVTKTVNQAQQLYKNNVNTLWMDSVER